MTLSSNEFIRRFLLHVLPNRFQRIRYYGFLGNRYRQTKLAQCRRLLSMREPDHAQVLPEAEDYRDQHEDLTGISLRQCPHCQRGRMVLVAMLPRSCDDCPNDRGLIMNTPLVLQIRLARVLALPVQRRRVARLPRCRMLRSEMRR